MSDTIGRVRIETRPEGLVLKFPAQGFTGLTASMLLVSGMLYFFITTELVDQIRRSQSAGTWIFGLAAVANTAFALWWIKVGWTRIEISLSSERFSRVKTFGSLALGRDDIALSKITGFELVEDARIGEGVSLWRLAVSLAGQSGLHYSFGQGFSHEELIKLQGVLQQALNELKPPEP